VQAQNAVIAMAQHTSVYIVPTHRWYIERTVWLIAGIVLLAGSALALWIDPRWILAVTATGLVSINVSLTGFCPVGNALRLFGFTPMLGTSTPVRWNLYFMQTDRWYLERRIYLVVGFNLSVASVLVLANSLWWSSFIVFVGGAMVWFAATGYYYGKHAVLARRRTAPQSPNGTFRPLRKVRDVTGLCPQPSRKACVTIGAH